MVEVLLNTFKQKYIEIARAFKRDGDEIFNRMHIFDKKEPINVIKIPEHIFDKKIKRILMGIAFEFYLKAAYSKKEYLVFKTKKIKEPSHINNLKLEIDDQRTIELSVLIDNLKLIFPNLNKNELDALKRGANTLKEWRNDSAHKFFTSMRETGLQNIEVNYAFEKIYELVFDLLHPFT